MFSDCPPGELGGMALSLKPEATQRIRKLQDHPWFLYASEEGQGK